jgi:hypothetical protein
VNLRSIKGMVRGRRLGAVRGTVIVAGDDQVLEPASMAGSAEPARAD